MTCSISPPGPLGQPNYAERGHRGRPAWRERPRRHSGSPADPSLMGSLAVSPSPLLGSAMPWHSLQGGLTRRCPGKAATAARDLAGRAGAAAMDVSTVMIGFSWMPGELAG